MDNLKKGSRTYMKRSKKLSFGRDIGNPLPDKTFHFAITNDGKKYELYLDGVRVFPKQIDDFTIEGWRYSNKYINEMNKRSKWQRIKAILRSNNGNSK